jgi:AraC family transcriptional regulator of adaptative response / DNA-3-methyladenine glycosylase II
MRAMRDPDAFLPSDLGVRHALEQLGGDGRPAAAEKLAERWRPYRAYALQHLWATLHPPRRAKSTKGTTQKAARRNQRAMPRGSPREKGD